MDKKTLSIDLNIISIAEMEAIRQEHDCYVDRENGTFEVYPEIKRKQ